MKKALLLAYILVLPMAAQAEPNISSVVLTENGLEIQGSGFGSENPMLFWDDVAKGFEEGNFVDLDPVPVGEDQNWGFSTNAGGWPFVYSETSESRSIRSSVVYRGEGRKGFIEQPKHRQPDTISEKMFVSWWYKPMISPEDQGGSNKFIRIWDDSSGKGTRISWTQMHLTCFNTSEGQESVDWAGWGGDVGKWNHMMVWVDLSKSRIKTWTNGKLIHDAECTKDSAQINTPLFVGLIGFDHGSSSYQDMVTELDDFYIGSSRARVEVSTSPTWSEVMEKEILPVSIWSNEVIKTGLVDGSIKLSEDMYVYVVDESGAVNSEGVRPECLGCPHLE